MKELLLAPQKCLDPGSNAGIGLFMLAEEINICLNLLFPLSSDVFTRKYYN